MPWTTPPFSDEELADASSDPLLVAHPVSATAPTAIVASNRPNLLENLLMNNLLE